MLSIFQRARLLQRFSALPATGVTGSIKSQVVTRQFNTTTPLYWQDDHEEYKLKRRASENSYKDEGTRGGFESSSRERNAGPSRGGYGGRGSRGGHASYNERSGGRGGGYNDRGGRGGRGGYGQSRGNDGYRSSSGFGRQGDSGMQTDGYWYPENTDTHGVAGSERRKADWSVSTPANERLESKLFGKCKAPTQTLAPPADISVKSTSGNDHKPVKEFADMNLGEIVTRNLDLMKLPSPTPIQSYAMPAIMAGHNILASAQTGSGKTAAFLTPTISRMCQQGPSELFKNDTSRDVLPLVLVLSPTRELCNQIFAEAQKLTYRSNIRPYVCYGGTNITQNINELRKGTELLVATPGRLKDLVDRGVVSLRCIQTLILDEADFMLDLGFSKAVNEICFDMDMAKSKQTLLFSATFPADIMGLARNIMSGGNKDTVKISIGRCGSTSDTIEQKFMTINGGYQKKDVLINLMKTIESGTKTLIFVATKVQCRDLTEDLKHQGFSALPINGDLNQGQRENALNRFKSGQTEILVATEVAARGIDVPAIDMVINYDMPSSLDQYVHRIGRTGRVGRKGTAISFLDSRKDNHLINGLKELLSETKQEMPNFMEKQHVKHRQSEAKNYSQRSYSSSDYNTYRQ